MGSDYNVVVDASFQVELEDDETSKQKKSIDDEYAQAGVRDPKICVTTSRDPSSRLKQFAKELKLVVPNAQRINRGNHKVRSVLSDNFDSSDFEVDTPQPCRISVRCAVLNSPRLFKHRPSCTYTSHIVLNPDFSDSWSYKSNEDSNVTTATRKNANHQIFNAIVNMRKETWQPFYEKTIKNVFDLTFPVLHCSWSQSR